MESVKARCRCQPEVALWLLQSGNPAGKPVVVVHGGPGGGTSPGMRQFFDPTVLPAPTQPGIFNLTASLGFAWVTSCLTCRRTALACSTSGGEQSHSLCCAVDGAWHLRPEPLMCERRRLSPSQSLRCSCGLSEPHASLDENTTFDLVGDMEVLRNHLKIDKWQVWPLSSLHHFVACLRPKSTQVSCAALAAWQRSLVRGLLRYSEDHGEARLPSHMPSCIRTGLPSWYADPPGRCIPVRGHPLCEPTQR